MRKITEESVDAFMNARRFKKSNTEVEVKPNVTILKLFGNEIAYRYNDPRRTLSITNCGWRSVTTKERLNGIPGVSIYQRDHEWYLNDKPWDGELTDVPRPTNGTTLQDPSFGLTKAFLMFADLDDSLPLKKRVAYKERIVFAKMRSMIPDWQPPSDWVNIPDEEKLRRIKQIQEEVL